MKKTTKVILILVAALVVAAAALAPKILTETSGKADQANFEPPTIPVEAIVLQERRLDNKIILNGAAIASESVSLKSEIAGKIVQIAFREGAAVAKAILLFKIDDNELQTQLEKVRLKIELAEIRESRQKKLLEKEGISLEEYQITLNELNTLKADEKLLLTQIEKTEIRAPFSGRIGLRDVSEGSYVNAATELAVIRQTDPIKIEFNVPQRYWNEAQPGAEIRFKMPPAEEFYTAKIYAAEPAIDEATRTMKARALFANRENKIPPGAYVEIELVLESDESALMVPSQSISMDITGTSVFLYKSGTAQQTLVETGARSAKEVQILNGVNAGDTLITSGIIQLKPGAKVKLLGVN